MQPPCKKQEPSNSETCAWGKVTLWNRAVDSYSVGPKKKVMKFECSSLGSQKPVTGSYCGQVQSSPYLRNLFHFNSILPFFYAHVSQEGGPFVEVFQPKICEISPYAR
jgi:hypothetical protein